MYGKLFTQMYDGTLCTKGPWQALVTFQQMLILADPDGVVDMTAAAIHRRTTVPMEIIEIGLPVLLAPDPESRTPTEEGRRLLPLSEERTWGWRIVNYKHYRDLKREEDRREYHRQYYRTKRSPRVAELSTSSTEPQQAQPIQPKKETEAEAEALKVPSVLPAVSAKPIQQAPAFEGDSNLNAIQPKALVRLSERWELPEQWGNDAEALGWQPKGILIEAERFRQYYVSGKGQGTRRSLKGWRQGWSNWLSKAERFKS